jgi:hypothetical protein
MVASMKPHEAIIGLVLIIILVAAPAAGFSLKQIDLDIAGSGDADITAHYSLSLTEQIIIFLRIAQPEPLLQNMLEQYTGRKVIVQSVTPSETTLSIRGFAVVERTENETSYITPSVDFSLADRAVRDYWFSRFVDIDASPERANVSFPDGYKESFNNITIIPSIRHQIEG